MIESINTIPLSEKEVALLDATNHTLQCRVSRILKARGFNTQTITVFVLHCQLDAIVSGRDWSTSRMVEFFLRLYQEVSNA